MDERNVSLLGHYKKPKGRLLGPSTGDPQLHNMVQKGAHVDIPLMDYLTWFFERQLVKSVDSDQLFIDADNPEEFVTRGQTKKLAQQIGYSLRQREGIGANGLGIDVVSVFSENQVSNPI
jgi:hypothetical protein